MRSIPGLACTLAALGLTTWVAADAADRPSRNPGDAFGKRSGKRFGKR